ncbi:p-hydroxybenzoic acid efflux pump subunit AaeB [Serratia sp. TSA_198.1]|jgi:p-hydroxybenzoic acid efflux pump subunit AaeB|uniref:p-hydroxybenzoic acid efflux pump subunit AaeB n=1 Tax=Serratia plymuthica TaxID=82996 RepID=A0A2X4VKA5_SERPL|nr:p-hydroxybenzoic acid efflux pump subunit AaeB [Serratia plymuthica]QPS18942.1 p-hydroxybenzoic acid efflux pump subunit AaeB [Serratia plymuthica]QPS56495.1 p-hydroxybenzoic acid efflux pump subunit AaeB [Serratia plymuthica]QPS65216.1 p-hydroxybenzoic acid efflux pump subunit AaeB [Serratia plymuthica]RKS62313.1 p-hydroxybenzoic acid efflux pump subunit AaeB [Serratia plymuthica]UNK28672.1 p-hydroxybenzoic acid efflux pump subunit AaeB [Serratia plymuthica]
MNSPTFIRLRFAFKLSFAIVFALFVGFHLNLETPRWSAMTAAIVAAGPAFAAGGEPFSGAIRHRGWLRIIGTFIGCFVGLVIIVTTARAPVVMLLLCCMWAGFCTWISSLIKVENSYAWGLAGYTALIIIVTVATSEAHLLEAPQFAIERCSEIVLGIVSAVLADLLFSPRSIKLDIDRAVDKLLVDQYLLMQMCVSNAEKEDIDRAWSNLVKSTTALNGMRSNLMMESSRWQKVNRRVRALHTLSLTLITQACETYLILLNHPDAVKENIRELLMVPAQTPQEIHKRMKLLRQVLTTNRTDETLLTITSWVGAATRYLLLAKGVHTNSSISAVEEDVLSSEVVVRPTSAEGHHAMINGLRTFVATTFGSLLWLWTGWTSGSGFMVIIAVITSLAMRTPAPRMVAMDFVLGMLAAIPVGSLFFMVILPATQQSILLLCLSLGLLAFFIGIEVQKRRLGSLGLLAGTINILVLSNPMTFNVTQFLDGALGQFLGSCVGLMVLLLIRDNSRERTGRTLLNQFVGSAVSALTTKASRRRQNHLPALYQQLNQLLMMFPNDIAKYRLALNLIIAHQRMQRAEIPVSEELSAFHKQIRNTADHVVSAKNDVKRAYYYDRLLREMNDYQQKLVDYQALPSVTGPVKRLVDMLHRYRHALID